MNEQLMRSNKELEAFAYVAADDLKEPLHQIEAFSQLLKRVFDGDALPRSDPKVWLDGIQTSTRRLRELIDDVADDSRLGRHSNPMADAGLDAILTAVKADLGAVIEATGATIVASPLPALVCDHGQIRQMFQNIISNALKYRHPARLPLILIDASVVWGEADTDVRHLSVLTLTISDNGIGFDEQYRERSFEPFQRLHSSDEYEGSGIGLAICQKVINRHHGSLTASSRPGEGSVFTINLPVRPAQAEGYGSA